MHETPKRMLERLCRAMDAGVRLPIDAPEVQDPRLWQGENLLGFALMEVRAELRRSAIISPAPT